MPRSKLMRNPAEAVNGRSVRMASDAAHRLVEVRKL